MNCSNSNFEPGDNLKDHDFFPLEVGNEWVYEVDSFILQQNGNDIYMNTSFVKETVTELFDEIDSIFVINRSSRQSVDDPWIVTEVYSAEKNEGNAYKTERNKRFTKLVFPIRSGKSWNGNSHFDTKEDVDIFGNKFPLYDNWNYQYQEIDTTLTLDEKVYNDFIRVEQADLDDGLNLVRSYEDYGRGLGLVYREISHYYTPDLSSTLPWEEKAEYGFNIKYRLVSFN